MGEARMDVIDSEIGYLGFHDSESYGLVWKVKSWCYSVTSCRKFMHATRERIVVVMDFTQRN